MASPEPLPCGPDPPALPDGEPFPFQNEWRTETVILLVVGVREENAFDRLPILADALEEAGCDEIPLLNHCRYCTRHEPSCWAVERVLPSDQLQWTETVRERHADAVTRAARRGNPYVPRPPTPWLRMSDFDNSWVGRLILVAGAVIALVLLAIMVRHYITVWMGKP